MSYQKSARYYRAADIAIYISEGHTVREAEQEFRISARTILRDLDFLAGYGFGEQHEKCIKLYLKARRQIDINSKRSSSHHKSAKSD